MFNSAYDYDCFYCGNSGPQVEYFFGEFVCNSCKVSGIVRRYFDKQEQRENERTNAKDKERLKRYEEYWKKRCECENNFKE